MSFLTVLKTIGEDIEKGLEVAAPIVTGFVPAIGPILTEIEAVIKKLEAAGQTLTTAQISAIAQAIAAEQAVAQAASTAVKS